MSLSTRIWGNRICGTQFWSTRLFEVLDFEALGFWSARTYRDWALFFGEGEGGGSMRIGRGADVKQTVESLNSRLMTRKLLLIIIKQQAIRTTIRGILPS